MSLALCLRLGENREYRQYGNVLGLWPVNVGMKGCRKQ